MLPFQSLVRMRLVCNLRAVSVQLYKSMTSALILIKLWTQSFISGNLNSSIKTINLFHRTFRVFVHLWARGNLEHLPHLFVALQIKYPFWFIVSNKLIVFLVKMYPYVASTLRNYGVNILATPDKLISLQVLATPKSSTMDLWPTLQIYSSQLMKIWLVPYFRAASKFRWLPRLLFNLRYLSLISWV